MARDKGMKALVEQARSAGVEVVGQTRGGHLKLVWQGEPIFLPSTPSCSRTVSNCRALLRRKGVPLPSRSGA